MGISNPAATENDLAWTLGFCSKKVTFDFTAPVDIQSDKFFFFIIHFFCWGKQTHQNLKDIKLFNRLAFYDLKDLKMKIKEKQ